MHTITRYYTVSTDLEYYRIVLNSNIFGIHFSKCVIANNGHHCHHKCTDDVAWRIQKVRAYVDVLDNDGIKIMIDCYFHF
jgi:hypothetical protein